jgi:predicted transcriptional regulator
VRDGGQFVNIAGMTQEALAELVARVSTWSEEAKEELAQSIVEIEARHAEEDDLSEEDYAAIERGVAAADAGRFAPDGAVEALFNRYFKK